VKSLDAFLDSRDVVAVLRRDVDVRLVDISNSGCLLRTEKRLAEGTTGVLRLSYAGVEYVDDVRIMRCQPPTSGESCFRIGVEFLWTTHPGERSLRRVLAGLRPDALKGARLQAEGLG
jgi:hypothetical protein